MNINEVVYEEAIPIEGYGPGFVRLGGEVIEGGAIIHAKGAQGWAGFEDTDSILALTGEIDFILMGTGEKMQHVPAAFRAVLEEAGIGVELMATPTACRTYNVLASEGRRMAAVLVPV